MTTQYQVTRELGPYIDQIEFEIPEDVLKAHPPKQYSPKRVSASGIKDCSRQWYYKLNAATQPLAREERKEAWDIAAAHGTLIHDQIQRALMAYDLVVNPEAYLPRTDDFTSGRIDGQLTDRRCLLEIKTVGSRAWAKFPDDPKFYGYMDQIQLYLEKLDLPEALLVCVRREPIVEKPLPEERRRLRSSLCKEFIILRDRQRGQELISKAVRIKAALDFNIVPKAEPGDGCFFCAHKHLCDLQDMSDAIEEEEETLV